jgi:hypothetical protein
MLSEIVRELGRYFHIRTIRLPDEVLKRRKTRAGGLIEFTGATTP